MLANQSPSPELSISGSKCGQHKTMEKLKMLSTRRCSCCEQKRRTRAQKHNAAMRHVGALFSGFLGRGLSVSCGGTRASFYGKPLLHVSPVQLDIRPSPAVIVIIHSFPMSVRTRLTPACWRSMSCLHGTFSRSAPQTACPRPGTNLNKAFILVLRLAPRDAKVRLILLI